MTRRTSTNNKNTSAFSLPNIVCTTTTAAVVLASAVAVSGFSLHPSSCREVSQIRNSEDSGNRNKCVIIKGTREETTRLYGLFDGVKDAFTTPPPSSSMNSERETPIDRWMGWSVVSQADQEKMDQLNKDGKAEDFVDSMDEANYVSVSLTKPMGIVFEENDADLGGIFIQTLVEDGVAAKENKLREGDQLVSVNDVNVYGKDFDESLKTIVDTTTEQTRLSFFRGTAMQLYGPTGPSQDWLNEFCKKQVYPFSLNNAVSANGSDNDEQ